MFQRPGPKKLGVGKRGSLEGFPWEAAQDWEAIVISHQSEMRRAGCQTDVPSPRCRLNQTGAACIPAPRLRVRRPGDSIKKPPWPRFSRISKSTQKTLNQQNLRAFGFGVCCEALFNCLHSVPRVDLMGGMRSLSFVTGGAARQACSRRRAGLRHMETSAAPQGRPLPCHPLSPQMGCVVPAEDGGGSWPH